MENRASLPRYVQISEGLIRDINAGRLLDGERLPPERDMAAQLGIAVGTLRKALKELERRDMLERRHGSGNYVKTNPNADSVYAFFRVELVGGGGLPTARLLSFDRLAKPAELPPFGASDHAYRMRRLRLLNETPAALEEIWLDAGCAGAFDVSMLSDSLYLTYREKLGIWIERAEDAVSVAAAPDWSVEAFAPAPGEICAYIERMSWDQNGRSVEFSRSWVDPNRARYVARIR